MSKGYLLGILVLGLAVSGCKFQVSYPDSFALPDTNQEEGTAEDTAQPDASDVVEHDIPETTCVTETDCLLKLGEPYACNNWECMDGVCTERALDDWTGCDDRSVCTYNDHCVAGVCMGDPTCADDGNECTKELCDSTTGDCYSQEVPGCTAGCKGEGEKLGTGDLCCQSPVYLSAVAVCSSDWTSCGEYGNCPSSCCDYSTSVCANVGDGYCASPWETPCNSSDCNTDQCSAAGGLCVSGTYSDPAGEQGPCENGWVLSELSCGNSLASCCMQKATCLENGVVADAWSTCCDSGSSLIPVDESAPVPLTGDEPSGSSEGCVLSSGLYICTHCGDGTCDYGETHCNCGSDCGSCALDSDCGMGGVCLDNVCKSCLMEKCDSALDEDCDGYIDEEPCVSNLCGASTGEYTEMSLYMTMMNPQAYDNMFIMVLGWSKTGESTCLANPIGCTAPLVLVDPQGTQARLPLTGSDMGKLVGCAGATPSTLVCSPFQQGQSVVVWGMLSDLDSDGEYELEYAGHCVQ